MTSELMLPVNQKYLEAMEWVENVSRSLKTISWIWGGFVTDVNVGRLLREHGDLDYLTQNLTLLKDGLAVVFSNHGWQVEYLGNGDIRFIKESIKAHFGNVESGETARWTHNGEKGSLVFPVSWLGTNTVNFMGIEVHVVAPELQYVLKEHPEILNPEWQPRENDLLEKQYLRDILVRKDVDVYLLHKQVVAV